MIKTYKGHVRGCSLAVATKLYAKHQGASVRTYGLQRPDNPKNEQDFVSLGQAEVRRLIKQLQAVVKK